MKQYIIVILALLWSSLAATAQQSDTVRTSVLESVEISAEAEGMQRLGGAENGTKMGQAELFRAACCNLGESFVTNPSVDVNYNDAAVGARQIKLLGLSGRYVQMLCEGLPLATGAASPYQLGRVPGSWMKSLQVSKGASSVKNGYQSLTGQIDVEYIKPDNAPKFHLNLYTNSMLRTEANALGSFKVGKHSHNELLLHAERDLIHHDQNDDQWVDLPMVSQLHMSDRFKMVRGSYIMHAGFSYFNEHRRGGTTALINSDSPLINLKSQGAEAYMKHALLLDYEHNTNIALMSNAHYEKLGGSLGQKGTLRNQYQAYQWQTSTQLMLEHEFNDVHQLSTGLSLQTEWLKDRLSSLLPIDYSRAQDVVPGLYAQYTFTPSYRFTAMGGLRIDHSTLHHRTFLTPRMHLKWMATDWMTLRASAGKGYRTMHPMAEYHYLFTSGRTLVIDSDLPMEEAFNTGISAAFYIPAGSRTVTIGAEYYYTHFLQQVVLDYDSDPTQLHIAALSGRSYSHTVQVDASYEFTERLSATAAFRLSDVRCTYGGRLMEGPLQSRYKGLLTLGWQSELKLWHIDLTLQLNGPGRMPTPYTMADGKPSWEERFPAYPQLNLQLTRDFRWGSVYLGGENLTGYQQPNPVINADDPSSSTFDPTLLWGPVNGAMVYIGMRWNL